ncbi:MAG: DUF2796 domain-containing protein [Pseudomonadota bacterium]
MKRLSATSFAASCAAMAIMGCSPSSSTAEGDGPENSAQQVVDPAPTLQPAQAAMETNAQGVTQTVVAEETLNKTVSPDGHDSENHSGHSDHDHDHDHGSEKTDKISDDHDHGAHDHDGHDHGDDKHDDDHGHHDHADHDHSHDHAGGEAHVHGAADMAFIRDGNTLEISLEAPLNNFGLPENTTDLPAPASTYAGQIVTLIGGETCRETSQTVEAESDGQHGKMVIDLAYTCSDTAAISALRVDAFAAFPGFETIDLIFLDGSRQTAATLTPETPVFELGG